MKLRVLLLALVCSGASSLITLLVAPRHPVVPEERGANLETQEPRSVAQPIIRDVVVANTIDWSRVESADYLIYIQNLRSIGCPRETVADIIVADVNKLFSKRAKEFLTGTNALPRYEYWKPSKDQRARAERKEQLKKQLAALDTERVALLKRLLPNDLTPEQLATPWSPIDTDEETSRLDFLTQEKQSALKQINADMDAETRKRIKPGTQDVAGLRELERLRLEREARIKEVLTPEEKLEYDLRFSPTATRMRSELEGMNVSETEFRQILALRKDFEDEYSPLIPPETAQEIRARIEADSDLNTALRTALGNERYADYRRSVDPSYQFLRSTFRNSDIPQEQLNGVYNVWSAAQAEADRVRNDARLSNEERIARLQDLSTAAQTQIRNVVGNGPGSEVLAEKSARIFSRLESLNPPRPSSTTAYFPK